METAATTNLKRPQPQALASTLEALAARFGNRLITSQAVRDQHAHTTTWLAPQPPDAVVMAQETADIQDVVRICAKNRVPVIAFGTGTSLEGQAGGPLAPPTVATSVLPATIRSRPGGVPSPCPASALPTASKPRRMFVP